MKRAVVFSVAALAFAGFTNASLAADAAQLEKGKTLFTTSAIPACSVCHTMADAQATGTIGPNLDELKPDLERVKKVLKDGLGAMPSFAATLSEDDRAAVAAYVVQATGGKP